MDSSKQSRVQDDFMSSRTSENSLNGNVHNAILVLGKSRYPIKICSGELKILQGLTGKNECVPVSANLKVKADITIHDNNGNGVSSGSHNQSPCISTENATSQLPPCDCLNFCGDDPWLAKGKSDYCANHKAAANANALKESILWHLPDEELPADNLVVLGFFDDLNEGEPVWPCLRFNGQWLIADGMPTEPPKAWACMPRGPLNTPWMKVRSES